MKAVECNKNSLNLSLVLVCIEAKGNSTFPKIDGSKVSCMYLKYILLHTFCTLCKVNAIRVLNMFCKVSKKLT